MTVGSPRKFPIGLVVLAVGIVALVATVLLTMNRETTDPALEFGSPLVTGSGLPLLTETDLAIGLPIPEVVGTDFSGEPVVITRNGRPKILLFLAHWCPHCQNEVPVVRDWVASGGLPTGVDLIAVATSTNEALVNFPPSAWLDGEEWNVPTVVDDAQYTIGNAYGLEAFPFWVFVAPDGTVALRYSGELPAAYISQYAQNLAAMVP